MSYITHVTCWNCGDSLLNGDRGSPEDKENYFFWCNPSCKVAYNKRVKEQQAKSFAESKEASTVLAERYKTKENCLPGKSGKKAKKTDKSVVTKTAAKSIRRIRSITDASQIVEANTGKRSYICRMCGDVGHNARTCAKLRK